MPTIAVGRPYTYVLHLHRSYQGENKEVPKFLSSDQVHNSPSRLVHQSLVLALHVTLHCTQLHCGTLLAGEDGIPLSSLSERTCSKFDAGVAYRSGGFSRLMSNSLNLIVLQRILRCSRATWPPAAGPQPLALA